MIQGLRKRRQDGRKPRVDRTPEEKRQIVQEGMLGGKSAAGAESEKDRRIRQPERTLGRKSLEIEFLKNVVGE
jgi:hypothetical protein